MLPEMPPPIPGADEPATIAAAYSQPVLEQRRRRQPPKYDEQLSAELASLLRHTATRRNVHVRPDGLVHIDDICAALRKAPNDIMDVVLKSAKKGNLRFQHVHHPEYGCWIRAACSHSLTVQSVLIKLDPHRCLCSSPPERRAGMQSEAVSAGAAAAAAGPGITRRNESRKEHDDLRLSVALLGSLLDESRSENKDLRQVVEDLGRELAASTQRVKCLEEDVSAMWARLFPGQLMRTMMAADGTPEPAPSSSSESEELVWTLSGEPATP